MTDYIATGRVVPERIAAIVKGIAEACVSRRLRPDRRRDRRAPRPARARRVRRRRRDHRRGRGRPAARPRPGPSRRRGDRDGGQRPALQRLLPGPPRAAREGRLDARPRTSTSWAAPSARSCSSRPGSTPRPASTSPTAPSTHAMSHVTGGGLAANLERVLPGELSAHHRPRRPGPRSRSSTWSPGRRASPRPDLEATLNCGVGMVALTAPRTVDTAIAVLAGHGIRAWVAGEVRADAERAAAGSSWRASTPAGDWDSARSSAEMRGSWCAGTATANR